jgi:DNA-binding NarL/FixJ family response regulator
VIRVLLADDHPVVRAGLRGMLGRTAAVTAAIERGLLPPPGR